MAASFPGLHFIEGAAQARRSLPATNQVLGRTVVYSVKTYREAYALLKHFGVKGASLVHLNRFFNLQEFFPSSENRTSPFPISTYDIRPAYEAGIDRHNWLFIAGYTGLVRRITTVLPKQIFEDRQKDFLDDADFTISSDMVTGYSYDLPRMVTKIRTLPHIDEPVVIIADAGYFLEDADFHRTAVLLRKACSDVRLLVLVNANDDPDVTGEARSTLSSFGVGWGDAL